MGPGVLYNVHVRVKSCEITCMHARDEANEAALSSLGDLGEEDKDKELREKKEKVSLLGLRPPLDEIDVRVMVEQL